MLKIFRIFLCFMLINLSVNAHYLAEAKEFVNLAADYFVQNSTDIACKHFINSSSWYQRSLSVYVLDEDNYCLVSNGDLNNIWVKFKASLDTQVSNKIKKTVIFHNGDYAFFIYKTVTKNDVIYNVGSILYAYNNKSALIFSVKKITDLIKTGLKAALKECSDKTFILDSKFNILGGQNFLNMLSKEDKKKIVENKSGWINYELKSSKVTGYFKKIFKGNKLLYVVVSIFFENENFDTFGQVTAQSLVSKAISLIANKNRSFYELLNDFSDPESEFYRGPIKLSIFDTTGRLILNGSDKSEIWKNAAFDEDENGKLYVQEIIKSGYKKNCWVNFKLNNAIMSSYCARVDRTNLDGTVKSYIVCSGYFK